MRTAETIDGGAAVLEASLFANGYARISGALERDDCSALRAMYDDGDRFRSHIVMERHGFGRGNYKYFAYPLPPAVQNLRDRWYAALAPIANRWNDALGVKTRYPQSQQQFLQLCAQGEQSRPTALVLRYGPGDFNCLHEDVYGEIAFPFQMTVFLSGSSEYDGGEFVLVEQQPRRQSRPIVFRPEQGDALVIPNRYRPVEGKHGYYRTRFRHGVSEVRAGMRYTLGIIFHDAK